MASNKHFLHDRTVLLLVSIQSFMTLLAATLILLKLSTVRGKVSFVTQFRSQPNALDFVTGGVGVNGTVWDIVGFIVAAVLFFGVGTVLAYRVYKIDRSLSIVILTLTLILLLFLIAVSNILLTLR